MTEQMSDDNENNINKHNLNVGQKFNDYEQLSMSVNAFCREHYHPFVIRTRSQKQVLYKCCHGIKQISKCQGKRPNQHYYYRSCPAQINFYRGKNEKWTLTKMLLNHNHTIGKEEYGYYGKAKKMNQNDCDTATDLLLSSAKDGMIASVLNKKSGKKFIQKDIQNFRKKLFHTSTETDQSNLMEFLAEIEENGGVYAIKKDAKEEVDTDDVNVDIDDHIEEETFTDDFDCPNKILLDREKFNTALTITKNIANILSNYGMQTFNKYVEELKVIESNARNGISLFEHESSGLSAIEPEEPEEQIQSNNEPCSNQSNKNLKFKTKLKSKGRPKRNTKQTTFYKKKIKIQNKK